MLLNGDQVVVNLVESVLPLHVRENMGKALIISIRYSFFESFIHSITDEEIEELSKKYPELQISNNYIEADFNLHFLFYNTGNEYWCFSQEDNNFFHGPISKWKFNSNHDSCWRTDAFTESRKKVQEIKTSIFDIHNFSIKYNLNNIYIPKHILPNFTNISNGKIFEIEEFLADGRFKNRDHILDLKSNAKLYQS